MTTKRIEALELLERDATLRLERSNGACELWKELAKELPPAMSAQIAAGVNDDTYAAVFMQAIEQASSAGMNDGPVLLRIALATVLAKQAKEVAAFLGRREVEAVRLLAIEAGRREGVTAALAVLVHIEATTLAEASSSEPST